MPIAQSQWCSTRRSCALQIFITRQVTKYIETHTCHTNLLLSGKQQSFFYPCLITNNSQLQTLKPNVSVIAHTLNSNKLTKRCYSQQFQQNIAVEFPAAVCCWERCSGAFTVVQMHHHSASKLDCLCSDSGGSSRRGACPIKTTSCSKALS